MIRVCITHIIVDLLQTQKPLTVIPGLIYLDILKAPGQALTTQGCKLISVRGPKFLGMVIFARVCFGTLPKFCCIL